jgi:hypothetical protein
MNWLKSLFSTKSSTIDRDGRNMRVEFPATSAEPPFLPPLSSKFAHLPAAAAPTTTSDSTAGYPNAFKLPRIGGSEIFDPSLKQYDCAYRESDPVFADDAQRRRWYAARQALLGHVLRTVSASAWRDRLVLRGSALMKLWLDDEARVPGDIDWVVLPTECGAKSEETREMLDAIARATTAAGRVGDAELDPSLVATDEIWTYERADGLRLTFSWKVADLPPGKMQADFVFGETLWEPPSAIALPTMDGDTIPLLAATPELSLAWKLLWILTDEYPQGKDLYDAVMLAERYPLQAELVGCLVAAVREHFGAYWERSFRDAPMEGLFEQDLKRIDWKGFVREYPWVDSDLDAWGDRLKAALPQLWAKATWER